MLDIAALNNVETCWYLHLVKTALNVGRDAAENSSGDIGSYLDDSLLVLSICFYRSIRHYYICNILEPKQIVGGAWHSDLTYAFDPVSISGVTVRGTVNHPVKREGCLHRWWNTLKLRKRTYDFLHDLCCVCIRRLLNPEYHAVLPIYRELLNTCSDRQSGMWPKATYPMDLLAYRGANGRFTLYEDEGDSYDSEKGAHETIPITWTEATHTLEIGKGPSHFPGMPKDRIFQIDWVSAGHVPRKGCEDRWTGMIEC